MSALAWVAVGLVGGLGALLRFALDGLVTERAAGEFPWGTLTVNLSGALLLGLLAGLALHGDALLIAGTGALGSYTTFSTWMLESHQLGADDSKPLLALNLAGSLLLGLAAAALGRAIGTAL
jgi:fluoride exporter